MLDERHVGEGRRRKRERMDRRADVVEKTRFGKGGRPRAATGGRGSLQYDDSPTGAGQRHRGDKTVRTGSYHHGVGLSDSHEQHSYASTIEATLSPSLSATPIARCLTNLSLIHISEPTR